MDRALLLCTRDIENMWRDNIPLSKAIRHMQYLINPQEVNAAKREIRKLQGTGDRVYKEYKGAKR
jgi:hypothetical protein